MKPLSCYDEMSSVGKNSNAGVWNPPPTLPVPERTAEIYELMGRLRSEAELMKMATDFPDKFSVRAYEAKFRAVASPENILKLLDQFEGKPK